jgi:carbon-monoxide dehydrogenase medium subunit
VKPAAFQYYRAHSAEEAVALLSELGDDAKLIAGGQSLVAMMNFRLARPSQLVDVGDLAQLRYVRRESDGLHIGALTTHHAVETDYRDALAGGFEVVADTMRWIGHLPIRTRGTVGGSIAHADATAEWCLLAVLLDAQIIALSTRGQRSIAAATFFHGFYSTALEPDEMIIEIHFPTPAPHATVCEYAQRQGDFAVVAAAVNCHVDHATLTGGRAVLGGVAPVPAAVDLDEWLEASPWPADPATVDRCAAGVADALNFDDSVPGGSAYTAGLVRHLVAEALRTVSEFEEVSLR